MKRIRQIIIMIAVSAIFIPTITSCKKGEGDPSLSLQSRKARVEGEWTIDHWIEEYSYTSISTYNNNTFNETGISSSELSGDKITISIKSNNVSPYDTFDYEISVKADAVATFTFKKDGTFTRRISYSNIKIDDPSYENVTFSQSIETKGTWNFLGGVEKDYKNKERIVLNILEQTIKSNFSDTDGNSGSNEYIITYSNGQSSEVWHLHTLKSDEMILDGSLNGTESYNSTEIFYGDKYDDKEMISVTGSVRGTLVQ